MKKIRKHGRISYWGGVGHPVPGDHPTRVWENGWAVWHGPDGIRRHRYDGASEVWPSGTAMWFNEEGIHRMVNP